MEQTGLIATRSTSRACTVLYIANVIITCNNTRVYAPVRVVRCVMRQFNNSPICKLLHRLSLVRYWYAVLVEQLHV